jgi:hypothetical protein
MFGFDRLALTDGATTISLIDAPYALALDGTDLGIATLRQSTLGGSGPYTESGCTIALVIKGACPANIYAALQAVWNLLDQAQRFWRGEVVNPVRLVVQASGSTTAAVEALVLRRTDADAPLHLPSIYEVNDGQYYVMTGVVVAFSRKGTWVAAAASATSGSTTVPGPFSVALTAATVQSPTKISLLLNPLLRLNTMPQSLFLISDTANHIALLQAKSYTATSGAPPVSLVNEAANFSYSGNVLRWQAQNVAEFSNFVQYLSVVTVPYVSPLVRVFASLRNNSASVTFTIALRGDPESTNEITRATVYAGSTTPQIVDLGYLPLALGDESTFELSVIATTTSAAHTLDIDYIALITQTPTDFVIATGPTLIALVAPSLIIDPRAETGLTAVVDYSGTSGHGGAKAFLPGWNGDAYISGKAAAAVLVWMAVDGTAWNARDSLGTSKYATTMTATRQGAYITLP